HSFAGDNVLGAFMAASISGLVFGHSRSDLLPATDFTAHQIVQCVGSGWSSIESVLGHLLNSTWIIKNFVNCCIEARYDGLCCSFWSEQTTPSRDVEPGESF